MRDLTPLESLAETSGPNRVDFNVRVVWPDGQVSTHLGHRLTLAEAAEKLDVLTDEIRTAASRDQEVPS